MNKAKKRFLIKISIMLIFLGCLIPICIILFNNEKKRIDSMIEERSNNFLVTIQQREEVVKQLQTEIEEIKKQNTELINQNAELIKQNNNLETSIKQYHNNDNKTSSRSTVTPRQPMTPTNTEWTTASVTAYCPCQQCCGKANGKTASGTKATAGRTIAASSKYPFGTKIEIKGYGIYTVEDRGGAIQANKIDMFFNTHQEALSFGRKTLQIRVIQ